MKQKGNILVILIILVALVLGITLYYKSTTSKIPSNVSKPSETQQPISTKSVEETKTFQSKNLKFSITVPPNFQTVPPNFQVEEKFTTIILKENSGEIKISRVATNFDNIDSYLKDLSEKNKFEIIDKEKININGSSGVNGYIQSKVNQNKNERIYFIYVDSWVYSFSTSSESIFDYLDQIAKSFRYIP